MAYRVTEDEVRAIIVTDADVSITPFIHTANVLVSQIEDCADDRGITLSTSLKTEIEKYLAAHFYEIRDPRYTERRTMDAQAKFEEGRTPWDQAVLLDISGCLDSFGKGERVDLEWLGLPPSEQTDYVDRD